MQRQGDWLDRAMTFAVWFIGTFILLVILLAVTESFTPFRLAHGPVRTAFPIGALVISLAVAIWRSRRIVSAPKAAATAPDETPDDARTSRRRGLSGALVSETEPSPPRRAPDIGLNVEAMLAGVVAQVRREEELHDGTWPAPPAVRLVPQVPIRDQAAPRSWLGGRPRMPAHMPWPEVDGVPCDFFAQIALADLPEALWQGQGPREGWLAFFLQPTNYIQQLIHIPELGPARDAPNPPAQVDGWYNPYGWRRKDALQERTMVRALPEWPVDIVAFDPPEPESEDAEETQSVSSALYANGFDLADPAFHPFDWPGMLALVDSALEVLESHYGHELASPNLLEQQLAGLEKRLAAGAPLNEAGQPGEPDTPVQIEEMEHRAEALRELIPASAEQRKQGRAALEAVRQIAPDLHAAAATRPFTPDLAEQLMAYFGAIRWSKVLRKRDPEGRPGAELIETMVLPITAHHPDASLFAWDYHVLHFDIARHAYCRDVDSVPAAVRAVYEPLWRDMGTRSAPQLGGFPRGYVSEFSPDVDVVLLEVPSNSLMGWQFGDVDDVVLIIRNDQLAAGAFSEARLCVSN
jgi:hypothetical protein